MPDQIQPGDEKTQRPTILGVTVKVRCEECDLEDEFDFDADDLRDGVEITTPCGCDRRLGVSADASAQFYPSALSTPPASSTPEEA